MPRYKDPITDKQLQELVELRWWAGWEHELKPVTASMHYSRLYQILLNSGMNGKEARELLDAFDSDRKRELRHDLIEERRRVERLLRTIARMKSRLFELRVQISEINQMENDEDGH